MHMPYYPVLFAMIDEILPMIITRTGFRINSLLSILDILEILLNFFLYGNLVKPIIYPVHSVLSKFCQRFHVVSISCPSSVIRIVCSHCALGLPSFVRAVHLSMGSITASRTPALIIGSIVKVIPGTRRI